MSPNRPPTDGSASTARWTEVQLMRLRDLANENKRLKKLVADLSLDNDVLKEALEGKY